MSHLSSKALDIDKRPDDFEGRKKKNQYENYSEYNAPTLLIQKHPTHTREVSTCENSAVQRQPSHCLSSSATKIVVLLWSCVKHKWSETKVGVPDRAPRALIFLTWVEEQEFLVALLS